VNSIRVEDVKKGQVIWECESGINMKVTALENSVRNGDFVSFMAIGETGGPFEIGYDCVIGKAYRPKLYDGPVYMTR
jgi:hypothetical protein